MEIVTLIISKVYNTMNSINVFGAITLWQFSIGIAIIGMAVRLVQRIFGTGGK